MFYVVDVGFSETQNGETTDGVCFAGECKSLFDASQKIYVDLMGCRLEGHFYGGVFLHDQIPVQVPFRQEIRDVGTC